MSVDINKNITLAGIYSDTITIGSMKTSGKGIFLSKTFTNVSPVIIDHEKKSALTNTLYELPIKCIDNDSDSLFAEITGLPDGFVLERLDSKNFKISGIVNSTQVGSYNLIFRVNDLYSTVQNTFTLTIVNSVSALPIEIIYSSIPLTGGILRNNAPLVYRFNKPVNIASLVYKLDTETGIIWNQNHTEFSVLLPKLENLKYYSGSIAISDNNGNTLTEQIGFNTDFEVLSVLENENDIIVAEILFDLHGKIISTNREFLNEGVYINRIQFQNGRELTKKLLISK